MIIRYNNENIVSIFLKIHIKEAYIIMDINVLKTFVAVCEYGGFSAAGEKLGYTQSTVSSQIKQLEKELDVVLFDRLYHRIILTEAGNTVLNYVRGILISQEKLMSELHHKEDITGELHLAMASSVCARFFEYDYLGFHERFPGIKLTITEAGTEQMFSMLKKNEADLVLTLDSHIYDSEFEICAECEERVNFVAAAEHPLTEFKELSIEDILNKEFILTEKYMSYRRILDEELASRSIEITPTLELGNTVQICNIAANSRMIAFLPEYITEGYISSGQLKTLPVRDCSVSVWTQLLVHKNKWHSPALNSLIDYYRQLI